MLTLCVYNSQDDYPESDSAIHHIPTVPLTFNGHTIAIFMLVVAKSNSSTFTFGLFDRIWLLGNQHSSFQWDTSTSLRQYTQPIPTEKIKAYELLANIADQNKNGGIVK